MEAEQRQNAQKPSTQKNERSPIWNYLRWIATVLAALAVFSVIFLTITDQQSTWLISAALGFISLLVSLFTWLVPTNLSDKSNHDVQLTTTPLHLSETPIDPQLLKQARLNRDWSQEKLASKLDVDVKTVTRWELGTTTPAPQQRQKLRELFAENLEKQEINSYALHNEYKGRGKLTRDFSGPVFLVDEHLPIPGEFYGRELECSELLECVAKEISVSVVGPTHIGKTWLIDYFRQFASVNLGENVSIGYVDAALPTCNTITGFVKEALKTFDFPTFFEPAPDLMLLAEYVHTLQAKRLVVLCIDNLDKITRHKSFDRYFFEMLRSMAQRDLTLVTTSAKPLISVVSESTHGSPFFNIFNQIKLAPFNERDALRFMREKGMRAGFTSEEQECALKYAQDHLGQWPPLRLQLAGKLLLEDKRTNEIYSSSENTVYWRSFSKKLDRQYKNLISGQSTYGEQEALTQVAPDS